MRLVMVGLDHTTAPLAAREAFSLDRERLLPLLPALTGGEVKGAVVLSTCNRTELFLSHTGDVPPDGIGLLCRALALPEEEHARHFVERAERQAADHLMRVASGMESSVTGDDQIITQVRDALETARRAGTADPLLEALFRSAVTAGKKVKTDVRFSPDGASVATAAAAAAEELLGPLGEKRVLILGNGVVGRLAAAELRRRGCGVDVAYRAHRGIPDNLPEGCAAVPYEERYRLLPRYDVVVSATASPRHTIEAAELADGRLPALLLDLAVPRDIDPPVAERPGVRLLNVDDLRHPAVKNTRREEWARAEDIIAAEARRFEAWRCSRRRFTEVRSGEPDFPVFVNLHGATVLMVGGGKVAARRAEKLLAFGARVLVVSPALSPEMEKLVNRPGLEWRREAYRTEFLGGVTLVIAATDRREVNQRVGVEAKERGILVSVADRRQECSFYFPAIVKSDCLTAGLVSNHNDHKMVRLAADRLLREMELIDEDCHSRQP